MNPLFMGEAGIWNGIPIIKMPKPIRFYSGDSLRWCASLTSETETATDLVPASFGSSYAVDRALLLGGQAPAEAWGGTRSRRALLLVGEGARPRRQAGAPGRRHQRPLQGALRHRPRRLGAAHRLRRDGHRHGGRAAELIGDVTAGPSAPPNA